MDKKINEWLKEFEEEESDILYIITTVDKRRQVLSNIIEFINTKKHNYDWDLDDYDFSDEGQAFSRFVISKKIFIKTDNSFIKKEPDYSSRMVFRLLEGD